MAKSHTNKNWKISAAQLTAAAAIITSVIALAVSIYETRIMRSWQQASTQPIVEIQMEGDFLANPIQLDFYLKNMGQGTAYVEGIKISKDGEKLTDFQALIQSFERGKNVTQKNRREPYKGYLEPSGRKHPLSLSWQLNNEPNFQTILEQSENLAKSLEKTEISVCFCSVFERCWISDLKSQSRAKLVPVCPADYT